MVNNGLMPLMDTQLARQSQSREQFAAVTVGVVGIFVPLTLTDLAIDTTTAGLGRITRVGRAISKITRTIKGAGAAAVNRVRQVSQDAVARVWKIRLQRLTANAAPINTSKLIRPIANPGTAQSRVNVKNVTSDPDNANKVRGWRYAINKHGVNSGFGPNKSKFMIPDDVVKSLLQHPGVVRSPVYNTLLSNGAINPNKFVRQVDVGKIIGVTNRGDNTSIITIITDRQGNLINMYPGSF